MNRRKAAAALRLLADALEDEGVPELPPAPPAPTPRRRARRLPPVVDATPEERALARRALQQVGVRLTKTS